MSCVISGSTNSRYVLIFIYIRIVYVDVNASHYAYCPHTCIYGVVEVLLLDA